MALAHILHDLVQLLLRNATLGQLTQTLLGLADQRLGLLSIRRKGHVERVLVLWLASYTIADPSTVGSTLALAQRLRIDHLQHLTQYVQPHTVRQTVLHLTRPRQLNLSLRCLHGPLKVAHVITLLDVRHHLTRLLVLTCRGQRT